MAGRIPQQFIDELLSRVDIVDVIDERVSLKKTGRDYMACCPFHDEKTPSFSVSAQKQFYYCFGCGAHGTAIGFLMDYARMDFIEAVRELASRVGLDLAQEAGETKDDEHRLSLYGVLQAASEFYSRQLREHPQAARPVDYLKRRGLSGEVAAAFSIGYAPPGWDSMLRALGRTEEARRHLLAAGLAIQKDGGTSLYDRFRDRVMFPIHDRRGRVIAFGGRVLDEGTPKYLNSPETPLFHKGRELYGLFQVRQTHRSLERLVVVEGYMDVVALAQYGVRYAVATLGTAVTADHLEQLFRTASEVVFCFDGDQAGRNAAWRALQTALSLMRDGRQVAFVFLPDGEDPDTLVRKQGREGFEEVVRGATSLGTFLYEHLLAQVNIATLDGRARLVELAKPLLAQLPSGAFQGLAIRRLGELSGIEARELATLIRNRDGNRRTPSQRRHPLPVRNRRTSPSVVRRIIALVLHHPHLASLAQDTARLQGLELSGIALLIEVLDFLVANPNAKMGAILEHFRSHEAGPHLAKLMAEEPVLREGLEQEFLDGIKRLAQIRDDQRYEYLRQKSCEGPLTEAEKHEYRILAQPTTRASVCGSSNSARKSNYNVVN